MTPRRWTLQGRPLQRWKPFHTYCKTQHEAITTDVFISLCSLSLCGCSSSNLLDKHVYRIRQSKLSISLSDHAAILHPPTRDSGIKGS